MIFNKRIVRAVLMALLFIFIVLQFFQPEKESNHNESISISAVFPAPASIQKTLENSCYDCHSNKTNYPWYFYIQPVGWWLKHHIDEAKAELNFSEFASYSPRRQYRKFEEMHTELDKNSMPLNSYTIIHRNAILNDEKKQEVMDWAMAMRDTMQNHFPADSLKRKSN